jgi:hypothetical protein
MVSIYRLKILEVLPTVYIIGESIIDVDPVDVLLTIGADPWKTAKHVVMYIQSTSANAWSTQKLKFSVTSSLNRI